MVSVLISLHSLTDRLALAKTRNFYLKEYMILSKVWKYPETYHLKSDLNDYVLREFISK